MNIEHIPTRAEIRARKERLGCYGKPEPLPQKPILVVTDPVKQPAHSKFWFSIATEQPVDFITLADIRDAVCEYFGTTPQGLLAKRRTKLIIYRRHLAIYLARELTTKSWRQIARIFGDIDHTSAIHAARRMEAKIGCDKDGAIRADIAAIRLALGMAV